MCGTSVISLGRLFGDQGNMCCHSDLLLVRDSDEVTLEEQASVPGRDSRVLVEVYPQSPP